MLGKYSFSKKKIIKLTKKQKELFWNRNSSDPNGWLIDNCVNHKLWFINDSSIIYWQMNSDEPGKTELKFIGISESSQNDN